MPGNEQLQISSPPNLLKALCDRLALHVTKNSVALSKTFAEITIQYIDENIKKEMIIFCEEFAEPREMDTFNMNYICEHPIPQHLP